MDHSMIDVHMHLVPGVDDGAADMRMALSMVLRASNQGVSAIIATPHSSAFDDDAKETKRQFQMLQEQVTHTFPDFMLCLGCEVYCKVHDMDRVIRALASGTYPTMNGTDYVLMEFSPWVKPEWTLSCAKALTDGGWKPVIAHMERYERLQGNMELVDTLRQMGCLIQVNAYSFFEESKDSIKNWARQLAWEKKADFLGTDAHRTYHRPPSAALGLNWLYENCGKAYADALAWGNARKLLLNR